MSKAVSHRFDIPASPREVFELRTSQAWVDLKAARLSDGSRLVKRTERPDGGVDIAVSRELPSGVPGFLQKFLPKDGRVVQNEAWGAPDADGVASGTWSVEIPGAPAQLGGTSTITPSGDGCVQVIEGTVKVGVPIIGGKAEGFIAEMTAKLMARENDLMVDSLSG